MTHTHARTDNPHPSRDVVTVKLNEKQMTEEVVTGPEGWTTSRNALIETVFEMNYSNGLHVEKTAV